MFYWFAIGCGVGVRARGGGGGLRSYGDCQQGGHVRDDKFYSIDTEENGGQES